MPYLSNSNGTSLSNVIQCTNTHAVYEEGEDVKQKAFQIQNVSISHSLCILRNFGCLFINSLPHSTLLCALWSTENPAYCKLSAQSDKNALPPQAVVKQKQCTDLFTGVC